MSSVNYSLKHKGVRLISSDVAWINGKNGRMRLNPNYHFVGKIETLMPNLIVSATDKKKPTYKGDVRYNKIKKHYTYVFANDGKNYKAVGITHQPITFGKKNMPLNHNPQLSKPNEKAYIRNGIISDKHKYFNKRLNGFRFQTDDYRNVKSKIRNYKKRYYKK